MSRKQLMILLPALLAMLLPVAAQKSNWTFFAGWNQALGDFAQSNSQDNDWAIISSSSTKGGAGYGFDLGVNYRSPLTFMPSLSLAFSADFFFTMANRDIRHSNNLSVLNLRNNCETVRLSVPSYLEFPLLVGLHYEFSLSPKYSLYLEAQGGVSFRWITNRSLEFSGCTEPVAINSNVTVSEYSYTDHFYSAAAFACHFSVGFVENAHWVADLGVWYSSGKPVEGYEDFSITPTYNPYGYLNKGSIPIKLGVVTPIHMTIRIGYRL